MATLGLDYAGGRPGAAAIKAAGYSFVCRYLTDGGPELPGKLLTASESADLLANSVAVACNFEREATRMLAGYGAGAADAKESAAVCLSVDHPESHPIYFSADFDATPAQQAEIDDYLRGCASVIGIDRVGIYGGYWVVKRCLDNHTATWAWQGSAWSPRNPDGSVMIDPRAHIFQRLGTVSVGGVECDVNEALRDDYGQHPISAESDVTRGDDVGLIPFILTPGTSTLAFECPVGNASSIIGAAWISAMSKGPVSGTVRYWFQDDNGGISESPAKTDPPAPLTFADGHSTRYVVPVPDGTTMIRADYTLLSGGTIVVETKPK